MGKRKKSSRTPQGPRKREPLATTFKCVFCNHESSVTVKIEKQNGVGNLNCKQCGVVFQSGVNYLSQPVDVYADWVDACENVKETGDAPTGVSYNRSQPTTTTTRERARPAETERYVAEEDGFVVDDEGDAEGEYADEDD